MIKNDLNLEILKIVAQELATLADEFVYLGGSTISLFVTEPEVISIRETYDVDCAVEVSHREEYEQFSKKLRKLGFSEDINSGVLCRFRKNEIILDVMPTDEKILGFSNIWYKDGVKYSIKRNLSDIEIRVFDLPYLMATKIEAYKGRGRGNFKTSHDIEDIITLIDGRKTIAKDLNTSNGPVLKYLKAELELFLENDDFINSLEAHISAREVLQGRKKIIIQRIMDFLSE